jgi:hypothetical protein
VNKSLPLNYDFEFVVEEITNINDKGKNNTNLCVLACPLPNHMSAHPSVCSPNCLLQ